MPVARRGAGESGCRMRDLQEIQIYFPDLSLGEAGLKPRAG